jgi:mRNA-degrading endonuclease RelE of RelBE toxin-antitoxin system
VPLDITATKSFERIVKKLHEKDKKALDDAVRAILENHLAGDEKRGDLAGVFVYKFKLNAQETLLAYELIPNKKKPACVVLLAVGPHENFYANLKRN